MSCKVKNLSNSLNSLRRTEHDKKELSELNNRFSNFLNIVKTETQQSSLLENSLVALKRQIVNDIVQKRVKYDEELHQVRQVLNSLCLDLSHCFVRERHSRVLIEFFSNFENLSDPVCEENLDKLSHFSVSQSSLLSSCSSQSLPISTSSSSYYTDSESTDSAFPPSPTHFSLETYLANLLKTKNQVKQDFENRVVENENLKKNCQSLSSKLNDLNNSLDSVKLENLTLNDKINNLKKEINFLKSFKHDVNNNNNYNNSNRELLNVDMDQMRLEIRQEFQNNLEDDLELYDESLQNDFLIELDHLQLTYDQECEKIEAESTQLLNELSELNSNLVTDYQEYEKLTTQNSILNSRLVELSSKLCEFTTLDKPEQEKIILNYTIRNIDKNIDMKKSEIKCLRKEINHIKNNLCKLDLFGSGDQFHLRPYNAQIEHTKSNLFSYLIIKFDFIYNFKSNKNRSILNSLKFYDSMDGYSITIENEHKILDIDLSEWMIRREIYSGIGIREPEKVIEYRLPKFFKLKRRKKVSFISGCHDDREKCEKEFNPSSSLNSIPKLTQLKCACCACKLMVRRSGDTDIMEVGEVSNWGSGLLTVTKLINNKNHVKMANFKFLKQIWVNDNDQED
ncbi:unnamed protein product [Brachionus calyciflorus]|uniref:Uncharacterized protein n=1 Tax=Brachionus calyciflorus TaxID=104777 RepID=A0A813V0H9_9BILA|nr:unnamed protein product [Brachionus calyciflorus]